MDVMYTCIRRTSARRATILGQNPSWWSRVDVCVREHLGPAYSRVNTRIARNVGYTKFRRRFVGVINNFLLLISFGETTSVPTFSYSPFHPTTYSANTNELLLGKVCAGSRGRYKSPDPAHDCHIYVYVYTPNIAIINYYYCFIMIHRHRNRRRKRFYNFVKKKLVPHTCLYIYI